MVTKASEKKARWTSFLSALHVLNLPPHLRAPQTTTINRYSVNFALMEFTEIRIDPVLC
jgi:hypothetical protein